MKDILKLLKKKDDFYAKEGASGADIKAAEKELGLTFAKDYKKYLEAYSVVSADGHEFTGIIESDRLNVVSATIKEKKKNSNIDDSMYVIERLDIDGIIIWQSSKGAIYQTVNQGEPEEIYKSFYEYVDNE